MKTEQSKIENEEFQAKGLNAGWSEHCLRQYPSGFVSRDEREQWFPRAFIISDEGKKTFDEVKVFIEGLPTELDRRVAKILLEDLRDEHFAEGKSIESRTRWDGKEYTVGDASTYLFDGVKSLAEWFEVPSRNDTYGVEIHEIFRDYVSTLNDEELATLKESWEDESEQLLDEKYGSHPEWMGYVEFGFVLTLSKRANVPKKILRHYRRIANSVHNDYVNGNY